MSKSIKLPENKFPDNKFQDIIDKQNEIIDVLKDGKLEFGKEKILLYFEIHDSVKNGKTLRDIVNVCYVNQVSAIQIKPNQYEVEFIDIEDDGFYHKFLKFKNNETILAVYLDEQKFLDYLESIHFPFDGSELKVKDHLQMLVNVVYAVNLEFLSGTLTAIINTHLLKKPLDNIVSLKIMRESLTDSVLDLLHLKPYQAPLEMDYVFPSLPKTIR